MSQPNAEIYEAEFRANEPWSYVSQSGTVLFPELAPPELSPNYRYEAELVQADRYGLLVKERRGTMKQVALAEASRVRQPVISNVERGASPSLAIASRLYCALGGSGLYLAVADLEQAEELRTLSVVDVQDYSMAVGVLLGQARRDRNVTQTALAQMARRPQSQISIVENAWDEGRRYVTRISNLPQYFEPLRYWIGYCGIKGRTADI